MTPDSPCAASGDEARVHSFLHAMPKVELHCHLLGTVRRATFAEYGEVSLRGLAHILRSHDLQHLACLHWLMAKLA